MSDGMKKAFCLRTKKIDSVVNVSGVVDTLYE